MHTHSHAMLGSKFPPSDDFCDHETLESDIALKLCHGLSLDEIRAQLTADPDDPWQNRDSDLSPAPASLDDALATVATEYRRAVPETSPDAATIAGLGQALAAAGVAWSFDEGYDRVEAAEHADELARLKGHAGCAYSTTQDVDRLIHTGTLYVGYAAVEGSGEGDERVGQVVTDTLTRAGLAPQWNGEAGSRIECGGLRYEVALGGGSVVRR